MKLSKLITKQGIFFLLIFSFLVFVGDRINFSKLMGAENQFFTLFQFFGPVAGAFLGPLVGVLSVLIAEVSSYLVLGKSFTLINVLRLTPMLFAAWYFGTKKDKISFLIPILAIILFIAHPVGRQVWFFSLFWTIPIIIKLLPKKYGERVFLRSLGATFTAHAVGGAMWNYIVPIPMTSAAWVALIPIVIYERLLFAGGIAVSYTKTEYVSVSKKYVMFKHHA